MFTRGSTICTALYLLITFTIIGQKNKKLDKTGKKNSSRLSSKYKIKEKEIEIIILGITMPIVAATSTTCVGIVQKVTNF